MFILFIVGIMIIWCIAEAFTTGLAVWHATTILLTVMVIMYKSISDKLDNIK